MAGYLGSTPVPQATQHRESFTATAAQTTFATAGYTVGFVDVYLNGVHLTPADVTATNGSDVVLGACLVNDIVDVISHSAFEVNNGVFTGSATFNEGSADADFRVESNGNANMLFVDGGENSVGIGERTGSFTHPLEVQKADNAYIRIASGTTQENAGIILSNQNTQKWKIEKVGAAHDFFILNAGGDTAFKIDQARIVTMPAQPAFLVRPSAAQNNLPINATTTVLFQTEVFDQNADFNNTNAANTFTAPVAGKYQFSFGLYLNNVDIDTDYIQALLVTSNRQFNEITDSNLVFSADATYHWMGFSVLTDMDAADTAIVKVQIPNSGQAQMDLESTASFFSGYLVA